MFFSIHDICLVLQLYQMPLRLHLSQTSLLPRQPLPGNHQPMTVDLLSPDTAWRGSRDSVDVGSLLPRRSFQTLHSVSLTWWKTTPMNSGSLQKTKQAKANPALHPRISRLSTHGVRPHRNIAVICIQASHLMLFKQILYMRFVCSL